MKRAVNTDTTYIIMRVCNVPRAFLFCFEMLSLTCCEESPVMNVLRRWNILDVYRYMTTMIVKGITQSKPNSKHTAKIPVSIFSLFPKISGRFDKYPITMNKNKASVMERFVSFLEKGFAIFWYLSIDSNAK